MRLCFIANDSIHAIKWIRFFAEHGHDILWLGVCRSQDLPEIPGVKTHALGPLSIRTWPRFLLKAWKARRIIRAWKPDLVHAHYAGVNGMLGVLSGYRPLVVTAWGSDILLVPKSRALGSLVRLILRRADLITCDAEHMRQAMEKLGADPHKIHKIMFGIDTERFRPNPPELRLGRYTHPVVISLRSFEPVYDVATLIRAIPPLLKQVPDASFIIAGQGTLENEIRELASKLGVDDKISFIGRVPNNDLPGILRDCAAYVSTSLSDAGIASSTAEAMACGLPVVVTDSGENAQWVKDGVNGYLVPVSNPAALAEKLAILLKDDDLRVRMGSANRAQIRQRDDYYGEMAKMENLYTELAARQNT